MTRARVEDLDVVRLGPAGAARQALVVHDLDVAAVNDPAARHTHLDAEVDVLEPVYVRVIEAAELGEQLARDREACAGHGVKVVDRARGRHVAGRVVKEVVRQRESAFVVPDHAAMLDRPVGIHQPRANGTNPRLARLLGHHLQRAGRHLGVVVEEDHDLAGSGAGAGVAAAGEVLVALHVDDRRAVLPPSEQLGGVIRGGVVDQHQLIASAELAAERALE